MASLSGTRQRTLHILLLIWVLGYFRASLVTAQPPKYAPLDWNSSCNYTVGRIPASVFFARATDGAKGNEAAFPLSPAYRVSTLDMPVKACFGPGEQYNSTLVAAGIKMPCGYAVKPGLSSATVDYWEENACHETIATNCYCYAIGRSWHGGYCMPGYRKWGDTIDYTNCSDVYSKVVLDGGVPVAREQVYGSRQPAQGHYIALVLWPQEDFHFFRRDSNGLWSQKRGDTFVTNTFPNGSVVTDVEDASILGAYRDFCGYFLVNPETHVVQESYYAYQQSALERLAAAEQLPGAEVNVSRLSHPSAGWTRISYPYYMFGLDAAVFEQGQRPLPWQGETPASLGHVKVYNLKTLRTVAVPVERETNTLRPISAVGHLTTGRSRSDATRSVVPERPRKTVLTGVTAGRGSSTIHNCGSKAARTRTMRQQLAGWRSRGGSNRGYGGSSVSAHGRLRPHWMSHLQQHIEVHRRDSAVREVWHR